ncbi:uncharacterized protein LOC128393396 [Panonychus citri]|uniref:uncharacterized protein LOC128393396 n=1 Tax=Panonychus citri TaxID=50023 RepID=UPI0023082B02|nr:uncharacterized protein LOC128393396 [Panonychus citri]
MTIFLGSMVNIISDNFSFLMSSAGIPIIIFASFTWYNVGNFNSASKLLHFKLTKLLYRSRTCNYRFSTPNLKTFEILDRLNNPEIGIPVGDFFVVKRDIIVSFVLENCSMIMLFACNLNSVIVSHQ